VVKKGDFTRRGSMREEVKGNHLSDFTFGLPPETPQHPEEEK